MDNNPQRNFDSDEIDIRALIFSIWEGKWLVLAFSAACFALGVLFVYFFPASFTATLELAPISTFQEKAYAEFKVVSSYEEQQRAIQNIEAKQNTVKLSQVNFTGINKKLLFSSLIEVLRDRTLFIKAFDEVGYLPRKQYASDHDYSVALRKLAHDVKILPPTSPDKLQAKRGSEERKYWTIAFEGSHDELFVTALSKALNWANEQVRLELEKDFSRVIELVNLSNQHQLESLRLEINNAVNDYKQKTSDRLVFLNEQAAIAKKLNIAKSTIESQSFSAGSTVLATVGMKSPYYLRGYEAIEKEIELITSREDIGAFIPRILQLRKGIREVEQDPLIKRVTKAFDNTPIVTKNDFSSAHFDTAAIEFDYKIKPEIVLLLSIFLGLILGLGTLFIRNIVRDKPSY